MKNIRTQVVAVLLIVAALFSAAAFLIPFEKDEPTFWIGYIAELIAIAVQIPVFKLAYPVGTDLKSKVLGYPLFKIGVSYLVVQTILSFVIIALGSGGDFPVWLAFLLCLIVLGVAVLFGMSANMARTAITNLEAATAVDTQLMKSMALRAKNLVNKTSDPALQRELNKLAEKITYSDPVSSPAIADAEYRLSSMFGQLEAAVGTSQSGEALIELCKSVNIALDDRNTACKASKA